MKKLIFNYCWPQTQNSQPDVSIDSSKKSQAKAPNTEDLSLYIKSKALLRRSNTFSNVDVHQDSNELHSGKPMRNLFNSFQECAERAIADYKQAAIQKDLGEARSQEEGSSKNLSNRGNQASDSDYETPRKLRKNRSKKRALRRSLAAASKKASLAPVKKSTFYKATEKAPKDVEKSMDVSDSMVSFNSRDVPEWYLLKPLRESLDFPAFSRALIHIFLLFLSLLCSLFLKHLLRAQSLGSEMLLSCHKRTRVRHLIV